MTWAGAPWWSTPWPTSCTTWRRRWMAGGAPPGSHNPPAPWIYCRGTSISLSVTSQGANRARQVQPWLAGVVCVCPHSPLPLPGNFGVFSSLEPPVALECHWLEKEVLKNLLLGWDRSGCSWSCQVWAHLCSGVFG